MKGFQEGERCGRDGCAGVLELKPTDGGCYCHINPPCGHCTTPREICPVCGWDAEEETNKQDVWVPVGPSIWSLESRRPLDPSKFEFRIRPHSNASQRVEGVYPEGMTSAEVEARVRGTFGGRFEHFGGGTFRYIAYTD